MKTDMCLVISVARAPLCFTPDLVYVLFPYVTQGQIGWAVVRSRKGAKPEQQRTGCCYGVWRELGCGWPAGVELADTVGSGRPHDLGSPSPHGRPPARVDRNRRE